MNLRIGICDDEPQAVANLADHIHHYSLVYQKQLDVETFLSGAELLRAHHASPFRLLILDIEMPQLDGMKLARYLRDETYDDIFIVFASSYPDYMQASFDVHPFHYLIKPVTYAAVERLLSDVIARCDHMHDEKLILDRYGAEHLIRLKDIVYIHALKGQSRYLSYHLATDEEIIVEGTISDLENKLARHGFLCPYRGYLVNLRDIQRIQTSTSTLFLSNGEELPISRRKSAQFKQMYTDRIIRILN